MHCNPPLPLWQTPQKRFSGRAPAAASPAGRFRLSKKLPGDPYCGFPVKNPALRPRGCSLCRSRGCCHPPGCCHRVHHRLMVPLPDNCLYRSTGTTQLCFLNCCQRCAMSCWHPGRLRLAAPLSGCCLSPVPPKQLPVPLPALPPFPRLLQLRTSPPGSTTPRALSVPLPELRSSIRLLPLLRPGCRRCSPDCCLYRP